MSDFDRVYLYRPGGANWCCDPSDLKWCLELALNRGWRPAVGDPSSLYWEVELEVSADEASALGETLELALASFEDKGNLRHRAATRLGSDFDRTRMTQLRELIGFCRQGGFESVDDEFPTFATREEVLERVRRLATDVIDLSYLMTVSGCVCTKWSWERIQIHRTLDSIDRYLGGDSTKRVIKEAEEAYAAGQNPVYWKAFVEGDSEKLRQLQEHEQAETDVRFYEDMMRYIRGEENDIWSGSVGEGCAENARALISKNPELALPENKTQLLKAARGF